MQAVMLIAGKSTRTHPLTLTRPKPLLKVANKTILEHNLEQLDGLVNEVVLVLGFKKEMVKELIKKTKTNYNFKISFAEQKEQKGTGHALETAEPFLSGRFLVFGGDDLFHRNDIKNCLEHDYSILVNETKNTSKFGVVIEDDRILKGIKEKFSAKHSLVNTGLMVIDKSIFKLPAKKSERGEYELTDIVTEMAKKKRIDCIRVKEYWLPIGYPWDLLDANTFLLSWIKTETKGDVEKGATLKGPVILGKGSLVKSGSYIEGPSVIGENCIIGPNCFIGPSTSIGNNCKIGDYAKIMNSIIMDNSRISHYSIIRDSIIGEGVNIGAGTITANMLNGMKEISVSVKGKPVSTGRNQFGSVIGDSASTGTNTFIYPGMSIYPGKTTLPGETVKSDIV